MQVTCEQEHKQYSRRNQLESHLGHHLEVALVHFVNLEGTRAARVNAQQDEFGRARHPPRVERRKVDALGHVLDELAEERGQR